MKAEVERLIDQLERAMDGDAWHGDPVMSVLARPGYAQADAAPPNGAHSIRDIVRHMTAWTREVHRRVIGAPVAGEAAWRAEIAALEAAHQALLADLRNMTDTQLFEPTSDPRNRETGEGVTKYVLLHGLAQHHAYHSGQIAILAKL
jgi:uncharacterized damage-inducible protein DinB